MRTAGLWGRLSAFDFPAVLNGYNNFLIQIVHPFTVGRNDLNDQIRGHFRQLHAPLCGMFAPNSVNVVRYASRIQNKSHANCDAQLPESNFQSHSKAVRGILNQPTDGKQTAFI